jgi:glucose/arabinose dehydrogenase
MRSFDRLQRLVQRCRWRFVSLVLAASCATSAKLPLASVSGPTPALPAPSSSRIPTVNVAKVVGWSGKDHPVAIPGTMVTPFARKLEHPRWLEVLPNGDVLVAETNAPDRPEMRKGIRNWFLRLFMHEGGAGDPSANRITLLRDADGDGVAEMRSVFLKGLNSPFGMALIGNTLYVANTDGIVRFPYTRDQIEITASPTTVTRLPAGPINHHWTRGLLASRDGSKLYVSVGSNSDRGERGMDVETERASILEVDVKTGAKRVYASGMRNPIGMAWVPGSDALWAAVNEREELGSDLPPDYMTAVKPGGFYGWPYSYHGQNVDSRVAPQRPDLVVKAITPDYALGPHTAAMGIVYAGASSLPQRFQNGMIVTQHGSWNRIPRSGYRVMFVPFSNGKPAGQPTVLMTGFLNGDDEAQGRPVGVALDQRGGVLIADDAGDVVWRITGTSPVVAADRTPEYVSLNDRYAAQVQSVESRGAAAVAPVASVANNRKCVDVNNGATAKAGNFTVAGFGMYASTWQAKQGTLVFKPATPQPGQRLTVRAEPLDGTGGAVEFQAPLSGSLKDGSAAYQVKMQLPKAGNWMISAQAGDSFGCFLYTLR